MDSLSAACRIRTGTRSIPASLAALKRLSPAMSSNPFSVIRITSGWSIPTSRIEAQVLYPRFTEAPEADECVVLPRPVLPRTATPDTFAG